LTEVMLNVADHGGKFRSRNSKKVKRKDQGSMDFDVSARVIR